MVKVLLVEDNDAISEGLLFSLQREGWMADLCVTYKETFKALDENLYDIVILDVMLPDGNGFEICKNIRQTSDVPIIFLTARDEEVDVVKGLEIGGDDYVTKPFRLMELISRVKAVLRRRGTNSSFSDRECDANRGESKNSLRQIIASGNIEVNFIEARIKKKGTEIFLSPIEYRLLSLFIQNAGRALSRNYILEKLWDCNEEYIDERTLTVNVRRLREKIEDDPSSPCYIVTLKGIGYKWNTSIEKVFRGGDEI